MESLGLSMVTRALSLGLVTFLMFGCSEERTLADLERDVLTLHQDTVPQVEGLPDQPSVEVVVYTADEARDPFAPGNVFGKEDDGVEPDIGPDPLAPDATRSREPLEDFPLDALKLVGTMSLDGQNWALINAPDGQIYRVVVGSYLGQNTGKIIQIDESTGSLEIEERLQGASGRWEVRSIQMTNGE